MAVLDKYFLLITFLVTLGYQLSGFFIAWVLQFDKMNFTGGSNFFLLAILTLCLGNVFETRNVVASVLVMVWAVRIAGFLLFRVLKRGSDNRFDDIRVHFLKFLAFWIGQILWIWTVSLPLTILNSTAVSGGNITPAFGTGCDIAGIILWAIGWYIESWADIQKYRFKSSKSSPKDSPMNKGLWSWSRHPPYFGEILCWWGVWVLCISPSVSGTTSSSAKAAQYGSIVSPLFTMILLLFGSGVPTAEKPQARRYFLLANSLVNAKPENANAWEKYKVYLQRTSVLVPVPPSLYVRLPNMAKLLLLDLPMYKFDEEVDGKRAIEEEQQEAGRV